MEEKTWYLKEIEEVYKELESSEKGLSKKSYIERIQKYGKNELPSKKQDGLIKIFFRQMIEPIVLLLIVTIIFSFIINEVIDALAITFIILVDLVIGTYQEKKASKTAQGLSKIIKMNAQVIRDSETIQIDSSELVIGDIIILDSGDKISADARIIECNNLQIDESILTGESLNVLKTKSVMKEKSEISDRKNMLYAGTSVITGRALGIVTATGINTEIGKIANKVSETKDTKSPLTIRMGKFSKQVSILVVITAVIIALVLITKGIPGTEVFLSVIALSVSAMPEGLPLGLTMALSIASNRMAKKNVVVKKLDAVESLGSCTVIASDKTGTLTVDEQTAKKIVLPNGDIFDIEGTGYNTEGTIMSSVLSTKYAYNIAKLGEINNEAILDEKEIYGDSIDIAFLVLARKAKTNNDDIEILGRIPYESENKYSAVFYKKDGNIHCTVKGSIEIVMNFSSKMRIKDKIIKIDKNILNKQNENLAESGYRVIALADTILENFENKKEYSNDDIKDLIFEGMVAFIDPIRKEVKVAINECRNAGIKVVMITGDHPLTAFSISKELGLVDSYDEVTTGKEIKEYLKKGQDEFDKFVKTKKVFTRISPIDKLEIVDSYKRQGEFVAVTGDGVNDVPALKTANIGIAMGTGTDVAKETSDMIIIDDNFNSIVSGIKEGRTAYSNIRKISHLLLSCGLSEVLFFLLSIIFNLPTPLIAIQLLWLNVVTDGLQDLALSFEKSESSIMNQKPRSPKESIFNNELVGEVLTAGLSMGIIVFAVWVYLVKIANIDIFVARSYIVLLMVFMQNINVFNCRSEKNSVFKMPINNPFVIFSVVSAVSLQIIVMEFPVLGRLLQISKISLIGILTTFLVSTVILVIMEIYKSIRYRKIKI